MYDKKKLIYASAPDGVKMTNLTDIFVPGKIISIVGGGGKTSTLLQMGFELADKGKKCILTTTTKMYPVEIALPSNISVKGKLNKAGKLSVPDNIDELPDECDYLIIEADGSSGLPIKMPESHEPAIYDNSDQVIAVVGMKGIRRPIGEVCHRSHLVCDFLKKNPDELIDEDDVAKIIMSPEGLKKNVGNRDYIVILNQADTEEERTYARRIAAIFPESVKCIITSYESTD